MHAHFVLMPHLMPPLQGTIIDDFDDSGEVG